LQKDYSKSTFKKPVSSKKDLQNSGIFGLFLVYS